MPPAGGTYVSFHFSHFHSPLEYKKDNLYGHASLSSQFPLLLLLQGLLDSHARYLSMLLKTCLSCVQNIYIMYVTVSVDLCGPVDLWTCGSVDLWTCGLVDLWTWGLWTEYEYYECNRKLDLCGPVDLWTCRLVDLWVVDIISISCM